MTVKELIKELKKYDSNWDVMLETQLSLTHFSVRDVDYEIKQGGDSYVVLTDYEIS